jgi:hypothetical protein
MPQTIVKNADGQIIGGTFSDPDKAAKAVVAFHELGFTDNDIQILIDRSDTSEKKVYSDVLTERGISKTQATYYDEVIRKGRTLVMVHGVNKPAPVIDIFDNFGAEHNPDGSRNAREDVSGMTAGAAIGAAAGGAVGALVAGPVGAIGGIAVGAVVGAGTGATAGKAAEHHK